MRWEHPSKDIKGMKSSRLKDKEVILAVTSSAAIYKAIDLARELMRHGAEVHVIMSPEAKKLISPDMFYWATGNPVITELSGAIEHIMITQKPENKVIVVAPATANSIVKIAMGIADNALLTTVLSGMGLNIPVIIVPAMHLSLWNASQVQESVSKLIRKGIVIVNPVSEEGKAKFPSVEEIVEYVFKAVSKKPLKGKKVLVTGGATKIFIDRIRFISNPSSGKMGLALALEAWIRGAETTVIIAKDSLKYAILPREITVKTFETYDEAKELILKHIDSVDVFLHAAAISDFKPRSTYEGKIESEHALRLELVPTEKIIELARDRNRNAIFVAFKAEWRLSKERLIEAGREYLNKGIADIVAVNDVSKGIFGSDNTEVVLVSREEKREIVMELKGSKREVAGHILDYVSKILEHRDNVERESS
ncbi:MAG: bifunctional phosphopantothenoylcysteine decarboxylase/phosphopantothenate--cysteine ligase CoaBC [Candidatus Njordarchaeales archaeon]